MAGRGLRYPPARSRPTGRGDDPCRGPGVLRARPSTAATAIREFLGTRRTGESRLNTKPPRLETRRLRFVRAFGRRRRLGHRLRRGSRDVDLAAAQPEGCSRSASRGDQREERRSIADTDAGVWQRHDSADGGVVDLLVIDVVLNVLIDRVASSVANADRVADVA